MALSLQVEPRAESGKGVARKLRREGMVPGVIYGKDIETLSVFVEGPRLQRLLQSEGAGGLIDLHIDGKTQIALVKDVQTDPVVGRYLHVDFHAVALDREVMVTVPVTLVGEDTRPNDGGIVTQTIRELSVYCLPTAIPERIEVDISGLSIGESISVGAVALPDGVRTGVDDEETVVSIVAPRVEVEEEPEADGEGAAEEGAETEGADESGGGDGDGDEVESE